MCETDQSLPRFQYPPPLSCPSFLSSFHLMSLSRYFKGSLPVLEDVDGMTELWMNRPEMSPYLDLVTQSFTAFDVDPYPSSLCG